LATPLFRQFERHAEAKGVVQLPERDALNRDHAGGRSRMNRAGLPTTIVRATTSLVTIAPRTDNRTISDGHPREDDGVGADPDILANGHEAERLAAALDWHLGHSMLRGHDHDIRPEDGSRPDRNPSRAVDVTAEVEVHICAER
jgi:hypothetical protein